MGKFKLIQLEEPAYNEACWKELSSANGKRDEGCAFPSVDVAYGVNSTFASEAPEIVEILEKATFPLDEVNASLAYMADNKVDATAAAAEFLKTKGDIWSKWSRTRRAARSKPVSSNGGPFRPAIASAPPPGGALRS